MLKYSYTLYVCIEQAVGSTETERAERLQAVCNQDVSLRGRGKESGEHGYVLWR